MCAGTGMNPLGNTEMNSKTSQVGLYTLLWNFPGLRKLRAVGVRFMSFCSSLTVFRFIVTERTKPFKCMS